jgi:two-component system, chemotaxis family, protein-glutamate methylesterase/glutaminase
VKRSTGRSDDSRDEDADAPQVAYQIVVVGTSWGGLAALRALITGLPPEYDLPLLIVQHRHRDSNSLLARYLQDHTDLQVCELEDKQPIAPRHIFIAPANYHALVEEGFFSLSTEAPVRYSRPSIDVAMTSAADAYGHRTVGVVLTGANVDGAIGLRRIADVGGMAVVQDPASAEVRTMPMAAHRAVPTARVFPLDRLAPFLAELPRWRDHAARPT